MADTAASDPDAGAAPEPPYSAFGVTTMNSQYAHVTKPHRHAKHFYELRYGVDGRPVFDPPGKPAPCSKRVAKDLAHRKAVKKQKAAMRRAGKR